MSRRIRTKAGRLKRHRTLFWIAGMVALVIGLLYWEQIALLYVMSTLAMCVLLLIVAFSDIKGKDEEINNNALDKTPHSSQTVTAQNARRRPKGQVPLITDGGIK